MSISLNTRIKNIEFLRIIGCISIVLLHLSKRLYNLFSDVNVYSSIRNMTCNGQKAVDLFFIISGFFFAYLLNKKYSLWEFFLKKIIRLYPVAIFIVIISFLISLTGIINFDWYTNLLHLFCIKGTAMGVNFKSCYIDVFWYVSSMLWVLGLYYYLIKNYEKKNVNLFIFSVVFFCYSFLICAKSGKINDPDKTFYYIFNVGMMRAFGGLGVGYFIGEWWKENSEKITKISLNIYQKIIITVIEFMCLYFMINNLMLHKIKFKNDMIFILDFIAIMILFIAQKGYISQLLNNTILGDISVFFAKYTFSFYMCHKLVFAVLAGILWKSYPEIVSSYPIENVIFAFFSALLFSIPIYHFVEKPCLNRLKNVINTPQKTNI